MGKNKLLATLAFIGVASIILGNFLDNVTYWMFSDLYIGVVLLVVGYKFYKGRV